MNEAYSLTHLQKNPETGAKASNGPGNKEKKDEPKDSEYGVTAHDEGGRRFWRLCLRRDCESWFRSCFGFCDKNERTNATPCRRERKGDALFLLVVSQCFHQS